MRAIREKIQLPSGHSFRVLRWTRSLRAVETVVAPGKTVQVSGAGDHWHYHVEMELTLFSNGQGTRFIGDHIGHFAGGDLVLLGEKLPHYWHTRGASSGLSVQWHFPASHPFWAFPENLPLTELFRRADRGLRIGGHSAHKISQLMHDLSESAGTAQLGTLLSMLAQLAAVPKNEAALLSMRSFNLSIESYYQQAVAKAVSYLAANFRDHVRLEDVLKLTDLSRPTFARQFKQHSGNSFSEFLNRLRLQAACRDLEQSDRSVLDIALASGFSQLSFFNRLFRRVMKCSPREFRVKSRACSSQDRRAAPTKY